LTWIIPTQRILYNSYENGGLQELVFVGSSGDHQARLLPTDTFIQRVIMAIHATVLDGAPDESRLFDSLEESFLKYLAEPEQINQARQEVSKLAKLLKMRVLLQAAYLMIIPHTSDISESKEGKVFFCQ
jgi:hypothetical protein